MSTDRTPASDKELWRSLALSRDVASRPIDDLEFAAWIDGRLTEVEASRIEAAVTADPELRRAALEIADIVGRDLPAAPERLLVRARALRGFEAERPTVRGGWLGRWLGSGTRDGLQRVAMATVTLIIAGGGFMVGGGLGASFAQERYESAAAPSTTVASSEISEFFASDGI